MEEYVRQRGKKSKEIQKKTRQRNIKTRFTRRMVGKTCIAEMA